MILKPLKSQLIKKDSELVLSVEYKKPKTAKVEWYHNGRKFPTNQPNIEEKTGDTKSTLKVKKFDSKVSTGKWEVRVGEHSRSSCSVRASEERECA